MQVAVHAKLEQKHDATHRVAFSFGHVIKRILAKPLEDWHQGLKKMVVNMNNQT